MHYTVGRYFSSVKNLYKSNYIPLPLPLSPTPAFTIVPSPTPTPPLSATPASLLQKHAVIKLKSRPPRYLDAAKLNNEHLGGETDACHQHDNRDTKLLKSHCSGCSILHPASQIVKYLTAEAQLQNACRQLTVVIVFFSLCASGAFSLGGNLTPGDLTQ